MHEDIRYFSYKRKSQFYYRLWRTNGKTTLQNFSTNSNILSKQPCFGFSPMRKKYARIRKRNRRTTFDLLCPNKCTAIDKNQTLNPYHTAVMSSFILHSFRLNIEAFIKFLENSMPTWIERVITGRFYFWQEDSAPCHTSSRTQW